MVDVLRFHEISESTHWVMNPFSEAKVGMLGEICHAHDGTTVLDLACGKGALLAIFAKGFGSKGVGVDHHLPFIADARRIVEELDVAEKVRFVEADASDPACVEGLFDVVSCLGATWIGGGLSGTLSLMRRWLAPSGWLFVGEPYWAEQPSENTRRRHVEVGEGFADLGGTLDRFEAIGLDLVEMVLASQDEWDRYSASQWLNVADWLLSHPDDPEADDIRAVRDDSRRGYLTHDRRCLGWGVFALREASG